MLALQKYQCRKSTVLLKNDKVLLATTLATLCLHFIHIIIREEVNNVILRKQGVIIT